MLSSGSSVGVGALQNMNSYSNERSSIDVEFASDPASGGFFHADYKKHDDLKQMLDSNKDSLKLEAMKRIISMIAKGRDASDLFPSVVKNVVSKNIEVKKLVYVYLVRYAEEQQDLALLSISTFQRALKDPNQLIRAGALRVLSSIRVEMIVPIVMLAIRDSASDMSPYVRKTAAHAIPKLYHLDAEQKDELIQVIEKLLSDRTTLVVGSAVMSFEEVCPERVDLIHKNYRKLCNLLVDVDEWGQIIIINMLTRYARTQFLDPNLDDYEDDQGNQDNKPFYDETTTSDDSTIESIDTSPTVTAAKATSKKTIKSATKTGNNKLKSPTKKSASSSYTIDVDHRLLLRQTKPLLQSRNASVVMTVAQLYHHVAPRNEVIIVAKALIRLLRSHKEVQSVVLTCIASMSTQRKSIFEPYMKSFFVRTSDPTHIKLLKLEILTNLATETSISIILREFQTYINSNDKDFVAATIQAIGRCAASINEVTETCLNGLVHLLYNRDEYVVAESVVVIKKLLQTQAADHFEIISQMAKLLDFITVPAARASILWLIGEYNEKVPKIAPDVLRKLAKTFIDEEDIVKLQVLNLSVKLYLTNPQQTELLCQYIFNLSRYDQNYDIRDRARFLKLFIFPINGKPTILSKNAKKIFLAAKPAPLLKSKYYGREQFQLGSLSHYLNVRTNGYHDLPEFPEVAPDSSLRNIVEVVPQNMDNIQHFDLGVDVDDDKSTMKMSKGKVTMAPTSKKSKQRSFYSESDKSSSEYTSDSDLSSSSSSDSDSTSNSDSSASTSQDEAENNKLTIKDNKINNKNNIPNNDSSDEESTSDSSSSDDDDDGDDDDDVDEESESTENPPNENKGNLLHFMLATGDILKPITAVSAVSDGGVGAEGTTTSSNTNAIAKDTTIEIKRIEPINACYFPKNTIKLLDHLNGNGLEILYKFIRDSYLFTLPMIGLELQFKNNSYTAIDNIEMINFEKTLPTGMSIKEFGKILMLPPNASQRVTLGIDFDESTKPIIFEIKSNVGINKVQLKAFIGELVRPVFMLENVFQEERSKLRGMNEHSITLTIPTSIITSTVIQPTSSEFNDRASFIKQCIYEVANVNHIITTSTTNNSNLMLFAGQTLKTKILILISIEFIKKRSNNNYIDDNDEQDGGDNKHQSEQLKITVNCENMVIGSTLLNELKLDIAKKFK